MIEKAELLTDSLKEELADVWEKAVRSSHHFLSEADIDYYRPRFKEIYLNAVDLYVVRKPGISAFMGLGSDTVEMLFVLPEEQGKGIGTALLDYAFADKHVRKIDVNEQNEKAYKFYLKRGYRAVGREEADAEGKPFPIVHLEK